MAAAPDFSFVKQDIALYLERKKEKTISLNYDRRLAERKEDEARKTRRNQERAARGLPPLSVTDITLQDIEAGKPLVLKSTAAMVVALSSAAPAASAVSLSAASSSASAAGVAVSSAPAEGAGYAKAPAAGDFVLEEAARVLSDLIVSRPAVSAAGKKGAKRELAGKR